MLWKPYYGRSCPAFSVPDDGNDLYNGKRLDGNFTPQLEDEVSWNCASESTTNVTENNVKFPQIVLIGARGIDENNTFPMWKDTVLKSVTEHFVGDKISPKMPRLQRINTLKVSNQYAMSGGALRQSSNTQAGMETTLPQLEQSSAFLCRGSMKWEQRLFAVYQSIFARLLSTYPDEKDFIIVEDDSVLVNPYAFVEEVCHARSNQMQFYSLYRSPLQRGISSVSCIYQHGTVAFYIRRNLMEKIMKERRRGWFCRFPIDMYISKLGPWYATRREVVGHLDGGRVGSKSEWGESFIDLLISGAENNSIVTCRHSVGLQQTSSTLVLLWVGACASLCLLVLRFPSCFYVHPMVACSRRLLSQVRLKLYLVFTWNEER